MRTTVLPSLLVLLSLKLTLRSRGCFDLERRAAVDAARTASVVGDGDGAGDGAGDDAGDGAGAGAGGGAGAGAGGGAGDGAGDDDGAGAVLSAFRSLVISLAR